MHSLFHFRTMPHSRWAYSRCDWDHGDISALQRGGLLLYRGFGIRVVGCFGLCGMRPTCALYSHGAKVCEGRLLFKLHLKSRRAGFGSATHCKVQAPLTTYGRPGCVTGFIRIQRKPDLADSPADPLGTQCSMCRLSQTGRLEDQPGDLW